MKRFLPSLLIAAILGCSHALATPSDSEQEETLTLSLDNAEVTDLVRWASHYIDKNIVIHPDVKGRVTVLAGAPFNRRDAYRIFKSVLQVNGYAVIEAGDVIKVIPETGAPQSSVPVSSSAGGASPEDIVVRIVKLNNISASQVLTLVRPLMPQSASLNAYNDSNMLLIADRASNIEKLLNIIQNLDKAGVLAIEVIPLKHAQASELLQTITAALPANLRGQADGARSLSLSADARTNSLLVSGNSAALDQIRALIHRLDQPLDRDNQTQVLRISFGDAKRMLPLLQSAANSITQRTRGANNSGASSEVKIEASEEHNAIVVTGPAEVQTIIENIVASLDTRRPQVLVEAMIVEVSDDLAKEMGIRWLTNRPADGALAGVGAMQGAVKEFKDSKPPALGSGLTLGFYSSDELRGLIRALETDTAANILSRPTIVAQDNDQAEILVGENVPFVTGSQANAATPAANPFQTIERQDIGVTLKVKPRINRDDSITLEVEQKAEAIAPSRADAADLITSKRSVKTRVVVDDNKVLVLGGLIRDELSVQQSKVPFFSNIPYLGRLFQGTSNTGGKKNLMVFIHPRILRDGVDNMKVTAPFYNDIKQKQRSFEGQDSQFTLPMPPPELEQLDSPQ